MSHVLEVIQSHQRLISDFVLCAAEQVDGRLLEVLAQQLTAQSVGQTGQGRSSQRGLVPVPDDAGHTPVTQRAHALPPLFHCTHTQPAKFTHKVGTVS